MSNKEYATIIANIHNKLIDINVKGDDVFRMAEVLQLCRDVVEEYARSDSYTQSTNEE